MNIVQSLAAPVGRILLSLMFILAGLSKIGSYAGTQGFMESAGVPGALLPLVIALEVLGGLAVLLGWQARVASFLLAGFTLLSTLLFHFKLGDQMQYLLFMKNVAIAGGFLMIVANGAGAFSIDTILHRNRGRS
jgi:putative oxidoreductase